ncbi:MAG: glycosyltransferase [Bacteroidetes bacterium]|nr:glycosyltransferase [Bacteroidota bacterium]
MNQEMIVAHCVRKSSQFRATFIHNQVLSHISARPRLIYTRHIDKTNDGGYAGFDLNSIPGFCSSQHRSRTGQLLYRFFKVIGRNESNKIVSYLESQHASLIHLHYGTDAGLYWRVMKKAGIPSVVSFYGYDYSSFPGRFGGLGKIYLQRRVFKFASLILAMSGNMKDHLVKLGCPPDKIRVHYYGSETVKFRSEHKQTNGNKTVLLTAGRLDEKKGHLFLLEALREYISSNPENQIEWIIAGDGNMKEELSARIAVYKMQNIVTLTGAYAYGSEELNELFSKADIYIQPSITARDGDMEGIPGTLVEAMSAGLPVISTYHAGIPEIIRHEVSGLLVKEWDVIQLAGSIKRLVDDPVLRDSIARNSKMYAFENLELRKKELELEDIYSELIS